MLRKIKMDGIKIRLSRLFPSSGKAVVVAVDHGQTFGPTDGLVDFTPAVEKLKAADAVLMSPQMVRFSGNLYQGKNSPVMIVRLNWNTIHCEPWHYREANIVRIFSVKDALAVGADIVLASLVLKTGDEAHDARNVEVFARSAEEARGMGVPLIGEVFPSGDLRSHPEEFHDYTKKVCRIICELGADAIKTFYTGERFAEVVEGSPIPIFGLGAEKLANELDALKLAKKEIQAGAAGVVFGRNVIQARDPEKFLGALKAVVQGIAKPEEAARQFSIL
jgi:DhnA family fructose-bisphosphate aldolase class Ia